MRKEFTAAVKVAAFKRCGGYCEGLGCGAKLTVGKFAYDHDNPDGLTGEPTLENCRVLCAGCHARKTKQDVADIARAKRREAKHAGARTRSRNPLPGSRASGWKRKMDGRVERRV